MEHQLREWLHRLEQEGMRVTSQRKLLLQVFAEAKGFLLPKDVYKRMTRVYPSVSYGTIYRNIRMLRDMGIVEQFDSEDGSKFKLCCRTHHHHHHLICLECDKVVPLLFCPMSMVEVPHSFFVVRHKFEVYGYCGHCKVQ